MIRIRCILAFALACSARLLMAAIPSPDSIMPVPPIQWLQPAPTIGHAFGSSAHQQVPADLAAQGYREDEYLFGGQARIYDFVEGQANAVIRTLGRTGYVDRLLIRRPVDPARFSGNVVLEVINSALDFDALAIWPYMQGQIMQNGDIWIGITASPTGIRSLKSANPLRYAAMGFGPSPDRDCPASGPEVGAIFDILNQLGHLLRQPGDPLNPLRGLDVRALIATGYSQGAMILATYTHAIAPNLADGGFDGFISIAGIGGYALNNCEALTDFASRVLAPVSGGIPLMQVQTTSETLLLPLGLPGESAHDQSIGAPYRYYEVAGSGHLDRILADHAPDAADLLAAGGYDIDLAIEGCHLAWPLSRFPAGYVYDNLLARMEAWIRHGTAPPPDQRFVLGGWLWPGRPIGGLRSPAVDVPLADYFVGIGLTLQTHGGGFSAGIPCVLASIEHDYEPARLKMLYGSHRHYLEQVRLSVARLLAQGYLTPSDGRAIIEQAAARRIP